METTEQEFGEEDELQISGRFHSVPDPTTEFVFTANNQTSTSETFSPKFPVIEESEKRPLKRQHIAESAAHMTASGGSVAASGEFRSNPDFNWQVPCRNVSDAEQLIAVDRQEPHIPAAPPPAPPTRPAIPALQLLAPSGHAPAAVKRARGVIAIPTTPTTPTTPATMDASGALAFGDDLGGGASAANTTSSSTAPPVTRGTRGQLAYDTQQVDARTARRLLGNRASAARSRERRVERVREAEAALAQSEQEKAGLRAQLAVALGFIEQLGHAPPPAALDPALALAQAAQPLRPAPAAPLLPQLPPLPQPQQPPPPSPPPPLPGL